MSSDQGASHLDEMDGNEGNEAADGEGTPSSHGSGRCPRCGVFIREDYLICPYCALSQKKECPHCRRQIPLNWNACAFCGHIIVPIDPPGSELLDIDIPASHGALPMQVTVNGRVLVRGRCPRCFHLIMDDARYCDSCGLKIEDRLLRPIEIDGGKAARGDEWRTPR
ncbi:MAG: zinc ribbon domain-containing protein [Methanomassiliicoccus sp.]|nr:zinc ribbon domain-containing protein [Methanomassiliicoccus sp.]